MRSTPIQTVRCQPSTLVLHLNEHWLLPEWDLLCECVVSITWGPIFFSPLHTSGCHGQGKEVMRAYTKHLFITYFFSLMSMRHVCDLHSCTLHLLICGDVFLWILIAFGYGHFHTKIAAVFRLLMWISFWRWREIKSHPHQDNKWWNLHILSEYWKRCIQAFIIVQKPFWCHKNWLENREHTFLKAQRQPPGPSSLLLFIVLFSGLFMYS